MNDLQYWNEPNIVAGRIFLHLILLSHVRSVRKCCDCEEMIRSPDSDRIICFQSPEYKQEVMGRTAYNDNMRVA
jgi:hypothetical protein